MPTTPLPRTNAGASLLTHLLVGKYQDHLPLYRIFSNYTKTSREKSGGLYYTLSISWLMEAISAPTNFTKSAGAMRICRPRTPALI